MYFFEVVWGLLAGFFVQGLYRLLRQEWPANYSALERPVDNYTRKSLLTFAMVRLGPVYIVGVLAAGTATAQGLNSGLVVVVYAILHVSLTSARIIWQNVRYGPYPGRELKMLLTAVIGMFVLLTAALAFYTQSFVRPFLPAPSELVTAAWTGFFVAVLWFALQQITKADVSPEHLLRQAQGSIGDHLWTACAKHAHQSQADPALVRAITAAESLQRPPWARKLERVYARVTGRPGTYGVAQMSSKSYLDDERSIVLLAESLSGYRAPLDGYGHVSSQRLQAKIEKHNSNDSFCVNVLDFYQILRSSVAKSSESSPYDGQALIIVSMVGRAGEEWVMNGTAAEGVGVVLNGDAGDLQNKFCNNLPLSAPEDGRRTWECSLPLAATEVRLFACNAAYDIATAKGEPASIRLG